MKFETQKHLASKTLYAALGAPILAGRKAREYGTKLSGYRSRLTSEAQSQFEEMAAEGRKIAKDLRERDIIDELQSKIDIEKAQRGVDKLRQQLDTALTPRRDPVAPEAPAATKTTAAKKTPAAKNAPAATKATAKKTAAAKKTPAAKKTAVAKKTPAAKKTSTTKKPATSKS